MKKILTTAVAAAMILALPGCAKVDKGSSYGEPLFECDSDNMLGFAGAYYNEEDEEITLLFNGEYLYESDYETTVLYWFEEGLLSRACIYVDTDGDSEVIERDDIDLDEDDDDLTIRFTIEDTDPDDITGFSFYSGNQCRIDLENEEITYVLWGGECSENYSQSYNRRRDSWDEVESELVLYPMTEEPPEIEPEPDTPMLPDIQPDFPDEPDIPEGGIIIPYTAEYYPDEWMPEEDEFLYGMIDTEGNVIFEPQFTGFQLIDDCLTYIVVGEVNGETLYGLLSATDGAFTGLMYDGAYYDTGSEENEPGHFNMSTYNDGILHVTVYSDPRNVISDDTDIVIDESVLPYDAATCGLSLCHTAIGGALIENRNEFYPHRVLIDAETGAVLHDFEGSYGDEYLFGDFIITTGIGRRGLYIYSYQGEDFGSDDEATGISLNADRYAVACDGMLRVFDREGVERCSIEIGRNAYVDNGCGTIGVYDNGVTTFYDEDLNVITEVEDLNLDYGYLSGRFSDGWGGNIIFVSFGTDTIYNFMNGASMPVNDDCFYSHERDYIFADDISNGNLSEHHWYLYDNEFNLLLTGDDYGDVVYDELTDDMYVSEYTNGVTTVYSLETYEPMFEADGRYSVNVFNGTFLLSGTDETQLIDSNGNVLFETEVTH